MSPHLTLNMSKINKFISKLFSSLFKIHSKLININTTCPQLIKKATASNIKLAMKQQVLRWQLMNSLFRLQDLFILISNTLLPPTPPLHKFLCQWWVILRYFNLLQLLNLLKWHLSHRELRKNTTLKWRTFKPYHCSPGHNRVSDL